MDSITAKYNVPVPRYTSYPAANFFSPSYDEAAFVSDLRLSHTYLPSFYSFYIHIPFCHTLCHYCGCHALRMRTKSEIDQYVDSLLRQLELIMPHIEARMPVAQIHYGGGSPTILSPQQLRRINQRIAEAFPLSQDVEIAIECHPAYLTPEGWEALVDVGFNRISIGVQDFDESVLRAIGRKPPKVPIENIVRFLHERGVGVNLDFIYGLTGQTQASFAQTIRRAIALRPERVVTFSYAHLPWLNPQMLKLEEGVGLPSPQVKQAMYDQAAVLFASAGYVAIGMDHFVRDDDELAIASHNGLLGRNFQGYCTHRTTGQVIALGNTGISQLPRCFAQNIKAVDAYMDAVAQGRLPIERGYALSDDEATRGELIATLMCNYQAPLSVITPLMDSETAATLDQMQRDGLLTMDAKMLKITPQGRPFVRNVAATFDPHYRSADKHRYSRPV